MEEKRIKSAVEIAMEKMASLSQLTPGELAEQKKKEYEPRGAAIANKYLKGAVRESDLQSELRRYRGQEGGIVRRAFLSTLCQSIKLDEMRESLRAIDGMQRVETKVNLNEIRKEVERILGEFRQQREQRYSVYENLEMEKLRELYISGPAVSPNVEESEDWRRELDKIQSQYDSRMNKLKENLSHLVGIL